MKKDLGFKISPSVLLRVLRGYILLIICALCALAGCDSGSGDPTTYTVTFNTNGGSAVAAITGVASGSTINKPADPAKGADTFDGWYKEAALTNVWNFASDTVTGNITLYAKWTPQGGQQPQDPQQPQNPQQPQDPQQPQEPQQPQQPQVTVTFDLGYSGGTPPAPASIDTGTALGAKYPPDPVRAGWEFDGWYNGNTKYSSTTPRINADITLTALWTAEGDDAPQYTQNPAIHPGNHFSEIEGGANRTVKVNEDIVANGLFSNIERGAGVLSSKWYRVTTSEADAKAATVDNPVGEVIITQTAAASTPHELSLPFTWHESEPGDYWYYVIVTNTNDKATETKTSSSITQNVLKVTVTE